MQSSESKTIKAENMKTTVTGLLCLLWLGVASTPEVRGQDEAAAKLRQAEQRIRAIYERGGFRERRFHANWLEDSTGYVVMETARRSRRPIAVRYDVTDGKRTELERGEPLIALDEAGGRTVLPTASEFSTPIEATSTFTIWKPTSARR